VICSSCHGQHAYPPCTDCGGSGISYCCDKAGSNYYVEEDEITQGVNDESEPMKESIIKIDYKDFDVAPDQTGWYVMEYKTVQDLTDAVPCDVVGPFATRAAASRSVLEASDLKDRREREHKNERSPSTPASASDDTDDSDDREVDTD
jgi:hypothetical protein